MDEVAGGGPGEGGEFADEGVGSDEAIEAGLFDGRFDGLFGGGEVDVDGNFSGEEDGEVGDEAAFSWGEDDTDAFFGSEFFELFGEGDGGAEDFIIRNDVVGGAVVDAVVSVFFESVEEGFGEGAVEEVAGREGFFGGGVEVLEIATYGGVGGLDDVSKADDGVREGGGVFDGEGGVFGAVDSRREDGDAEAGEGIEDGGGDEAGCS